MAQIKLDVSFGVATTTQVSVVASSLMADDILITVAGVGLTTVSISEIGTDGTEDRAGYVGDDTISGLTAFTQYSWTATQDGNSISGTFITAPESGDDFCFYFGSCDNNTSLSNQTGANPHTVSGLWELIKEQIEGSNPLPCAGILFVDDYGYVDWASYDDSAGTGLQSTDLAKDSGLVYDYSLAYLGNKGLLQDSSDRYIAWGQDTNRQWCRHNMNLFPQWGDHEFNQDIGWDLPVTDETTSPTNVVRFASGKAAWDAFLAPLQGSKVGSPQDADSNHWYADLGDVRMFTVDTITKSDAEVTNMLDGTETPITTLMGTAQIEDTLNATASSHAFKVFGLQHSIKYMHSAPVTGGKEETGRGAQHPFKEHILSEYQRLFTDTTHAGTTLDPKSLMHSDTTNGVEGTLVCVHGDFHCGCVYRHNSPAYADNAQEWFYSINPGTINGSINFAQPAGVMAKTTYDDSEIEYIQTPVGPSTYGMHTVRFDVYGSRTPKQMEVRMFGTDGNQVWGKTFFHREYRNDALDLTKSRPAISSADE